MLGLTAPITAQKEVGLPVRAYPWEGAESVCPKDMWKGKNGYWEDNSVYFISQGPVRRHKPHHYRSRETNSLVVS